MRHSHQADRPQVQTGEGWLPWESGPAAWSTWVVAVGFTGLLGIAILRAATGRPDWLLAWRVGIAFLLFAGVLMVGQQLSTTGLPFGPGPGLAGRSLAARLGLIAVLSVVVFQSRSPGIGLGVQRTIETIAIVVALIALCVLADDPRRHTLGQWLVFGCFATIVGIYVAHSLAVVEGSVASRQPLWAAVVMSVCLLILPQLVPRQLFLWALSRVAVVVVLLGLATYALGAYTIWDLQVQFQGTFTIPLVDLEVRAIRSLFVNRNTFAMVVLAGLVGAISELHGRYGRHDTAVPLVPTALVAINAIGFVLSFGRALWVIGVVVFGIYGASLLYGHRAVPAAVTGGVVYLLGGILLVYVAVRAGLLASDPSDRFHLWRASWAAITDPPMLFGAGTASPADVILAYRDSESPVSPHNSYFSVLIRTGLVGGLAYIAIVVTSLLEGVRRYRDVDAAVLSLAAGFAAHQVFEAYTMLWWTTGSVYASLAIGFLLFGGARTGSVVAAGPSTS